MPDWYSHIQVAKYLNMNPLELARAPESLYLMGVEAMNAEGMARNQAEARAAKQH